MKQTKLNEIRLKRILRVRSKIKGTSETPRLAVRRSNKHISAQLIDDQNHKTLVSAYSHEYKDKNKKMNKTEMAKFVGKLIAEKSKEKNIKNAVFDRRFYKYSGRIKALKESAEENGLKFNKKI